MLQAELDAYQPPLPDLSARIMDALPGVSQGYAERLLSWLFPGGGASLLRPVLAGTLPLVLGLALGFTLPSGNTGDMSSWELEEEQLLAPLLGDDWYE